MIARPLMFAFALAALAPVAHAGELSKEECVQAYNRGWDAKEQFKLTLARKQFLTCAQSSCPQVVQSECARYADDLGRLQPTVSFAARDASGTDLPDTTVYVDDVLVLTRLDDGASHDIDPGKHVIRFTSGGHDKSMTVVIETGEKGRTIVAHFPGGAAPAVVPPPHAVAAEVEANRPKAVTTHPTGAKLAAATGAVLLAGGAALVIVGVLQVPAGCSLSTHTCGAPPGDPVFTRASNAATMVDDGIAAGAIGAVALIGGAIWFASGAHTTGEHATVAMPWVAPGTGGVAVSGRF